MSDNNTTTQNLTEFSYSMNTPVRSIMTKYSYTTKPG